MKKSISILLTAILLCLAFSGCSSKAQNNLSRAIDNAGQGLDDSANRFRQNATRGWDNGTNTNGSMSEYYSDNYGGYGYYTNEYYGDDSGYQGYYGPSNTNYNTRVGNNYANTCLLD